MSNVSTAAMLSDSCVLCRKLIMRDRQNALMPCTALGCMELLRRSNIDLRGKEAVLIGDSNVVGTPLAMMLRNSGIAAYTLCRYPLEACPTRSFASAGGCLDLLQQMTEQKKGSHCRSCLTKGVEITA